ncbi:Transcriptional regulator CRZ1 [Hyphodiscus hymeniophilus]|uniref:Transcriptional regulator CRZ1 n=1 Tax=Hyphodiscus hymeniophilus TaxID=353542 RepID=A0A9P7AZL3_9HELO|nr:Transcriptional regulator CRZ1 [Hyphodiscus hymeniophilus]
MASEQTAVSTAAPVFATSLSEPATTNTFNPAEPDPSRTKSLKRSRPDHTQDSADLSSLANAGLGASSSSKLPRFKGAFSPSFSPAPLTGAAALEDQRRKQEESEQNPISAMSENPTHKALSSLMAGGGAEMSKPQDEPVATTAMSKGMSTAASAIAIPSPMSYEKTETSPASVTSLASLGSSTAPTATASSTVVASPAAMTSAIDAENRDARFGVPSHLQAPQMEDPPSNRALSFPGNVLAQQDISRAPPRGMSLPMPGQQLAPRSPSQKKHKCPYCETEFTRHHNLKSHLLTHSQEKPYVCQTCNMRFRRLHDLKRHMKLHTGERPHICPKCDRKFARGDALARHSKGQGGCAGRRASMGSFGGDDDYDGSNAGDGEDTGMDGIAYMNGNPMEGDMTEEERRRLSLPSIKAPGHPGSQDSYNTGSRTPSTYPPAGPRPGQSTGSLYPPNPAERGSSSSNTSPSLPNSGGGHTSNNSLSSMALSTGGGSMFSQSGITESPKPLSPAGMHSHQLGHDPSINRQRSPSLTTQFQQQHFGRRQSGRASPTTMSLPNPQSQGPKLPALSGLAPPDQRYTLSSQTPTLQNPNGSHPVQQIGQQPMTTSPSSMFQPPLNRSNPLSDPGRGGVQQQGSGDNSANLFAGGDRGVWQYAQQLEIQNGHMAKQLASLESNEKIQADRIKRQDDEINYLRSQLQAQNQATHSAAPAPS